MNIEEQINKNNELYAIFILWDSLNKYFDEVINNISNYGEIYPIYVKADSKEYKNFIIDIYDFNNQKELGIFKANKMYNGEKTYFLVILILKLNKEHTCFSSKIENENFNIVTTIKKNIRNKYKILIDDYFHDNIIHATDCFDEVVHTKKILKKHNMFNKKN